MRKTAALLALTAPFAVTLGCGAGEESGAGQATEAIVGGTVDSTTIGVVSIVTLLPGGEGAFCSGELIAPNLVLTARHCVSDVSQETIDCAATRFVSLAGANSVFVSPLPRRPPLSAQNFYAVAGVTVPSGSDLFCGRDIALLTLQVPMPDTVERIVPRVDIAARRCEVFSALGYGLTIPDGATGEGTRMRVDGEHVQCLGTDCVLNGDVIRGGEWASLDSPTCPGDSGGPALDSSGRVFGLDSRGPKECKGAIYTDVSSWKDFIIQGTRAAATLGSYDPPFWVDGYSSPTGPSDAGAPLCNASTTSPSAATASRSHDDGGCSLAATPARSHRGAAMVGILATLAAGGGARRRRRGKRSPSA